jgi:hypothetical protein
MEGAQSRTRGPAMRHRISSPPGHATPDADRAERSSMQAGNLPRRRGFAARCKRALMLAFAFALAQPALGHSPATPRIAVEIVDRAGGSPLQVYDKDGQRYVVGTPGHEYAIRIMNLTRERILAVTSVDGVNVVTGETASPAQSGYVIDAGGSVEIGGWRRSLAQTSAFYFTDLGDSYAARTGRPNDVGVIGVATFAERRRPVLDRFPLDKIGAPENAQREGRSDVPASASPDAEGNAQGAKSSVNRPPSAKDFASRLGTGFGRDETSYAQRVRFDRATDVPSETVTIRYDRRENLVAMGVLPPARFAERSPDPFPALHFVPPPR